MKNIDWKEVWKDPVWSKVIAAGIIFLLSQLGILTWSLLSNLNFIGVYQKIYQLLIANYLVQGWLILVGLLFIIFGLYVFFKQITTKNKIPIEKSESTIPKEKQNEIEILTINEAPTVFFHYRFCEAFPGTTNGITWFTSKKEINNRLKVLLEHPTHFDKASGHGVTTDPIWWFRGSSALYILNFKILNNKKVLINNDELKIEKIAAFRGRSYFKDFVYIQCYADEPTGLYEHNQLALEEAFNENGEYTESFGIYQGKFIKNQDYSDGSTIIRGKPVKLKNAEFRTRTLIKFNFIIAAKSSPYNCNEFNNNSEEYFGRLLKNEIELEEFVSWLDKFPRNEYDD